MALDTLKKYFGRFGEICDCVIMVDKNSSKSLYPYILKNIFSSL
jgi:hypothetical protein